MIVSLASPSPQAPAAAASAPWAVASRCGPLPLCPIPAPRHRPLRVLRSRLHRRAASLQSGRRREAGPAHHAGVRGAVPRVVQRRLNAVRLARGWRRRVPLPGGVAGIRVRVRDRQPEPETEPEPPPAPRRATGRARRTRPRSASCTRSSPDCARSRRRAARAASSPRSGRRPSAARRARARRRRRRARRRRAATILTLTPYP